MKKLSNFPQKCLRIIQELILENTHGTVSCYGINNESLYVYENNESEVLFRADEVMEIAKTFRASYYVGYGPLPVTVGQVSQSNDTTEIPSNFVKLYVKIYF